MVRFGLNPVSPGQRMRRGCASGSWRSPLGGDDGNDDVRILRRPRFLDQFPWSLNDDHDSAQAHSSRHACHASTRLAHDP